MTRKKTHRRKRRARGITELSAIEQLSRALRSTTESVLIGIGDDAAVLAPTTQRSVWTIDTSVEGVHFRREWLTMEEIAARSYDAAISDLAAMGARPVAALSSLILPEATTKAEIRALGRGQAKAAQRLRCPIIGGNIALGTEMSITITALGVAKRPLTRGGAKAGDELWLIGDVGLAGAGLAWLSSGRERHRGGRAVKRCCDAWSHPRALISGGRILAGRAHACIDLSDGLAGDAQHMAQASNVRLVIDESLLRAILEPELVRVSTLLRVDSLHFALFGGEDYALLASGPKRRRPRAAHAIGNVERGTGVFLRNDQGAHRELTAGGYDHFASRTNLRA